MQTPTLETKRLLLKPLEAKDAQAIFENWTSDERVAHFMRYTVHENVEVTKEWLAMEEEANKGDGLYDWAFILKETGEIIGSGGLTNAVLKNELEVGYNIMYDYWNQGIVTEAVKEILRFAKENLHKKKVFACHCIDNPASGKVLEKCGFQFVKEGTDQKFDGSVTFQTKEYEILL